MTAEEERHRLAGLRRQHHGLLFRAFTAVAGNTADGNVERRRVVDGETTAAGGQGQLLGRRIAVAQSGRTINKFKARTDRQLQHVLAFIFLIGHHRRNFQQIQPPQRLFIFRQTGAAAELNTQRLAALGVNARNRRGDNKRGGNGIRCGIGIAVIQPGLRQPDGRRYLKAVPLFLFISWINKAGTVNNNIVGMGRKPKNETEKKGQYASC